MQVELFCTNCGCSLVASPETPGVEILNQMADHGPWLVLGDGETFEDMIFNTLLDSGSICCEECGEAMNVTEETLGQMTMELLGSW